MFVNLHNHSHYSLLHSLASPKEICARAKELGQNSVGIADYGSIGAAWEALKASNDTGVKLIIGCEFYFSNSVYEKDEKLRFVVLLAKNEAGYRNILSLNRKGFDIPSIITKKVIPVVDWELLEKHSEGVICLTSCGNGIVSQLINKKNFEEAEKTLIRLSHIFKENLFVEVLANNLNKNATHYMEPVNQIFTNNHLIRLAKAHNIKIVPTTNSFYLKKEDAEIHDVMLAIGSMQPRYSNARPKYDVPDFYMKSYEEIKTFFSRNYSEEFADEICKNTVDIANSCEQPVWIDPKLNTKSGNLLPTFDVASEKDYNEFLVWKENQIDKIKSAKEDDAYLRFKCEIALSKFDAKNKYKIYKDRLEEELDVFEYQGFSSYMLIVWDYVRFALENGVSVGPGRGSAAGSLVAYFLNIHRADPIKYDLIFARFQNKERKSPPDIDLDFAKNGREKIINYIFNKYGNENVAQISNFSCITPKVFARDIARSLELGGSRQEAVIIGNHVADAIPKKIGDEEVKSYEQILKYSPLFSEYLKKYPEYEKFSKICGKYRGVAVHAAGILTSNKPLSGLVPLRKDKDGNTVIEYEKEKTEENGLIKMDILGLSTLDIIDETVNIIKFFGKEVPIINYDEYDKKTYDLISSGETFGVFQFGTSGGTIDLCKKIKPKTIEDLAIITTLARPAAKTIREDFIAAREGRKKVNLLHPSLKGAFEKTYGFGLFDESILQLGKDVAGWSLHSADRIRKMIKDKGKNPEKIAKLREEFINDAIKNNNIEPTMAKRLWDEEVNKFQSYTFNKSHAISYSMISFHTAFLKAHFPIEFLLANLINELASNTQDAEKNIQKIKTEIKKTGMKILPPDLNKSDFDYKVLDEKTLLTGFSALKFVGDDAIKDIEEKRPFSSFLDFMIRVDSKKVRSPAIQALAACGCFDQFQIPRKQIILYASDYRKKLQVWLKKHDPSVETFQFEWEKEEWPKQDLYALERHYLGEAFVCSLKHAYPQIFKKQSMKISDIKMLDEKETIPSFVAVIDDLFEFKIKKEKSKLLGQYMAKIYVQDDLGENISLTVFPDALKDMKKRLRDLYGSKIKLEPGVAVHISGSVNIYEDETNIIVNNLFDASPPPALPRDMKAKKISKESEVKELKSSTVEGLIEEIEDDLFQNGSIDFDDNDDID